MDGELEEDTGGVGMGREGGFSASDHDEQGEGKVVVTRSRPHSRGTCRIHTRYIPDLLGSMRGGGERSGQAVEIATKEPCARVYWCWRGERALVLDALRERDGMGRRE
eukprot:316391-Pleurochrysis_carterae.AAC.1